MFLEINKKEATHHFGARLSPVSILPMYVYVFDKIIDSFQMLFRIYLFQQANDFLPYSHDSTSFA